ncbi:sugar kinase [Agrobacterium sp. ES01]|uniref:sugar kinase n=1 Tax=Agrobacterium sp. ES01 TaxID=3420714 RepID=UPI003D0E462E
MSKRIVSIGECMVELALRADGAYDRNFAGDSFNSAWYLRHILPEADKVDYFTAVGEDTVSSQMLSFMETSGVGTGYIRRVSSRTVGLYMIELANGERSFSYWRDSSAAKLLAEDRAALEAAVAGRDLVIFSGITLAILSPVHRNVLLDVLAGARANGTVIAFDPNMRLRLWATKRDMTDAVTHASKVADIVLPSFDEEQAGFGDLTVTDTLRRYRENGAGTVIVKNGGGLLVAEDAKEGLVEFQPVAASQVVDTTAAGDSFNAGFLAARLGGATLLTALEQGAALAGKVIQQRGALVDVGQ